MVHLSSIAAAAAALAALPLAHAGLNTAAKAKGLKYFGTATDVTELADSVYNAGISNSDEFGQLTPGNSMKWDATEPSQNSFSYANGDAVVAQAQKNGQLMRCHNLVWYMQLPGWVTSGSWTNATLIAAMQNHITNVVTHYKGKCYAWDVVNEALNDDGTFRNSIFYQVIGEAYIPIAFATAAAADPNVKLYYNDYNIESSGAKATAAQNLVKMVKAYGAKIDGVGLQAHFVSGGLPAQSNLMGTLSGFTALGVEVAYTELDLRIQLPADATKLAQQATDYQTVTAACVGTAGCVGVTIWDWTDKYSWIPSVFPGYGAALPWDANYAKKPAYNGIMAALGASGSTGSGSTGSGSSGSGSSGSGSTPNSSAPATTLTTTTTTSGSTSTGVAQHWQQCGGNGWTGPTTCVSGTTCHVINAWFSQCL